MFRSVILRLAFFGSLFWGATAVLVVPPSLAADQQGVDTVKQSSDAAASVVQDPKAVEQWNSDEDAAEKAFLDGQYSDAERLWQIALSEAEKLGKDDLKVAQTLNQMTHLFIRQSRFQEAIPCLKRALAIREKSLGRENMLTAEALGNLALIEKRIGNDQEAEKLYLEVLDIKEHKLGNSSPSVATTKTNLANLYAEMRRCAEAQKLYEEALAIDEKAFGPKHSEVATDSFNIGALLYHCNKPEEALPHLERALKIEESNSSAKVPILHYIGLCHAKLKQHDKAESAYKQALELNESIKGKGHPDTMVHLFNLARSMDDQGRTDEAERLYKQALASAEQSLAKPAAGVSPDAALYRCVECCVEMAHFYHRHHKLDDSEAYYKKSLAFYDKLSAADKRQLYEVPRAYADLLRELKREKESDAMARKYIDVFDQKAGAQAK